MSRRNKPKRRGPRKYSKNLTVTGYIITKNGKILKEHGRSYPILNKIGKYKPTVHNISKI